MDEPEGKSTSALVTALYRATLFGVGCALACFAVGKPFEDSAIDGLIVALGGLVAWTTYHLISHRSDTLLMLAMNSLPIWRRPDDPWFPMLVISCLSMLGVGLVMGFVNRPQAEIEPKHEFAWWDAEMDGHG
jgi:hypothetical protein